MAESDGKILSHDVQKFRLDISEIATLIKTSEEIGADISEGRRLLLIAINMGKTSKNFEIIAKYLSESRLMMESAIEEVLVNKLKTLQQIVEAQRDSTASGPEIDCKFQETLETFRNKKYDITIRDIKDVIEMLDKAQVGRSAPPPTIPPTITPNSFQEQFELKPVPELVPILSPTEKHKPETMPRNTPEPDSVQSTEKLKPSSTPMQPAPKQSEAVMPVQTESPIISRKQEPILSQQNLREPESRFAAAFKTEPRFKSEPSPWIDRKPATMPRTTSTTTIANEPIVVQSEHEQKGILTSDTRSKTPLEIKLPPSAGTATPIIKRYTIEKASEQSKCNACLGKIKPGFDMLKCSCGYTYHEPCAKRIGKCQGCGAELL